MIKCKNCNQDLIFIGANEQNASFYCAYCRIIYLQRVKEVVIVD